MQITLDFELTVDDFADIIDAAGYAIGYWADEAEYNEPYHADDSEATYTVSCEERTQIYTLTKQDIEKAMALITEDKVSISPSIRSDVMSAIKENDYGYIDGYASDAIIQVACFGEIVYG